MNLLDEVKKRLLITGEFHDGLLLSLIEDVKQYLISAGVEITVVNSKRAIGCISKGVADLFNNNEFSDFFRQRAIQLTFEPETDEEESPWVPSEGDDNGV